MKTKEEIVANWLPRYTGTPLENFGKYILLVNFGNYIRMSTAMARMRTRYFLKMSSCSQIRRLVEYTVPVQ